jgi:hypothetical protein
MLNALSFDIQDHCQVHYFSLVVQFEDWPQFESQVVSNTHRIRDLLASAGCRMDPLQATGAC